MIEMIACNRNAALKFEYLKICRFEDLEKNEDLQICRFEEDDEWQRKKKIGSGLVA